jgi:ubiquinol-cytochrome c reductase iron-sulfur subunit
MTDTTNRRPPQNRRAFLYQATGVVAAAGSSAAAWPLIDQWIAHARADAKDSTVVEIADLQPGEQRTARWQDLPVFIARRTAAMLAAMQDAVFVAQLLDAGSANSLQPSYARNWHRSIQPDYAVLVGVCTGCGCVPQYFAAAPAPAMAGGYVCPCCASRYDPAGRAYSGIARLNLPVPPHEIKGQSVVIGPNACSTWFLERMKNGKVTTSQNPVCDL